MIIYSSKVNTDLCQSDLREVWGGQIKWSQKVKIIWFWGKKKETVVLAEVGHMWMHT